MCATTKLKAVIFGTISTTNLCPVFGLKLDFIFLENSQFDKNNEVKTWKWSQLTPVKVAARKKVNVPT